MAENGKHGIWHTPNGEHPEGQAHQAKEHEVAVSPPAKRGLWSRVGTVFKVSCWEAHRSSNPGVPRALCL